MPPERVVPWDWPLDLLDVARSSAKPYPHGEPLALCYVGTVSRAKGVWDLVEAVRLLREHGEDAVLDVAGDGEIDEMSSLVHRHGLHQHVTLHGRVGGDQVMALMRRSSFVCVPSHHAYPEGLPLTIYEAMASGTPLVTSDHPMFKGVVRHLTNGFVFRAGRPAHLASVIRGAWHDEHAYELVSKNAAADYPTLGLSTLWGDVIQRWVKGTPEDYAYLADHALAR